MLSDVTAAQTEPAGGDIPSEEWERIVTLLPIPCADVLPVMIDDNGTLWIGLIRRQTPFGATRWCHIGGRQRIDEPQAEAARRHLDATLALGPAREGGPLRSLDLTAVPPRPSLFIEFLRDKREGFGFDPRKHAVSGCYRVHLPPNVVPRPDSEALDFRWFTLSQIPDEDELWPGTRQIIEALTKSPNDDPELA